jgi:hypothetical protein
MGHDHIRLRTVNSFLVVFLQGPEPQVLIMSSSLLPGTGVGGYVFTLIALRLFMTRSVIRIRHFNGSKRAIRIASPG